MKKVLVVLMMFICLLCGCNKTTTQFSLDEKYYSNNSYQDLKPEDFNKLKENKESFAIFIYQPLCTTSYDFNQILTEFAKTYGVSFYKMSFADMKKTDLEKEIKYYPSLVIYHEGEMIDYLDANSDLDKEYYKSVEGFTKWFSNYVIVEKNNNFVSNENTNNNVFEDLKIDAKLDNVSYDENKVNIYFFWGDGCPHCKEEFKFFESIQLEYGDYFKLNTFEVWYNEENANLLRQFAHKMNDEVTGVPYTIIGNKTFTGFGESYKKAILDAIKTQYKNSYDVYFDK